MKVGELIQYLESQDKDMEVVIKGSNSGGYADSISEDRIYFCKLKSFWGNDRKVLALFGDTQIGRV